MNVASFLRQDRRNAERERASGNQRSAGRSGYTANLDGGPLELAERPEMRETLERYERVASVTARAGLSDSLPGGLVPAPGRSARSDKLDAAGFIDMQSQSVGVDIACWHTPPGGRVDERGWQIVFGWIVGSDRDLGCVALLELPIPG